MRVYEALRELGYEGGYDAVRRYARSWYREQSAAAVDAYVPLSFDPGEAYQFDWSHEIVLINATTVTVKVAQSGPTSIPSSRSAPFARQRLVPSRAGLQVLRPLS